MVNDVAPNGTLNKNDQSKLENTITKSLGVLQENGVYAFFLFLDARKSEKGAKEIGKQAKKLLRHQHIMLLRDRQEKEKNDYLALQTLTNTLDHLLLAHQLLEQALIYARYHAKALRNKN